MPSAEESANAVERLLAIKSLPLFAGVHADELAVIAEHARVCEFRQGEAVFAGSGAPVTHMHLVLAGSITEHRNGRPFRSHAASRMLGGVDALAQSRAEVTAIADEDSRTLAIDRDDLRDILEDNFNVLSVTLQGIAAAILRLRHALVPSAGFAGRGDAGDREPGALHDLGARIAFLRHTWIGHAKIRTLGQLARAAALIDLGDGERLWAEDAPAEHAAVVVRGIVACATTDARQRFEAGPGTIIGLEEALAISARWYSATARGDVTLLQLTRAAIVDALEDDSDTAFDAVAALATVACELRDQVAQETEEVS